MIAATKSKPAVATASGLEVTVRKPGSPRFVDLIGSVFGMLTVTEFIGFRKAIAVWKCRCECGNDANAFSNQLKAGRSWHCGCQSKQTGKSKHPLFHTWHGMLERCNNQNGDRYKRYGGRGIKVCERWANSFEAFVEDVGPRPSPQHSLDRYPNNDGDYEPGNVRWATQQEQMRNTHRSQWLTFNGETKFINDWAEQLGITRQALHQRLQRMPVEEALGYVKGGRPRQRRRASAKIAEKQNARDERVLALVTASLNHTGASPTLKEITEELRLPDISSALASVKRLEAAGRVFRTPHAHRGITLHRKPQCCPTCGRPLESPAPAPV